MNMDNYPHITIAEDGRLCSTGQHHAGFPRVLYDALLRLSYNRDIPIYRGRISTTHGQVPLNPMELWTSTTIGVKLDETIEYTA
jgi:hypothetical protein